MSARAPTEHAFESRIGDALVVRGLARAQGTFRLVVALDVRCGRADRARLAASRRLGPASGLSWCYNTIVGPTMGLGWAEAGPSPTRRWGWARAGGWRGPSESSAGALRLSPASGVATALALRFLPPHLRIGARSPVIIKKRSNWSIVRSGCALTRPSERGRAAITAVVGRTDVTAACGIVA